MKNCYLACTDYWNMPILHVHLSVQKVNEQVVLLGPLQTQHKFSHTRFTSLPGICQMKHCYRSCTDYWNILILSVHLSVQKVMVQVMLLGPKRTQHKFRNIRFTSLSGICKLNHCYLSCTDYWNILILSVHLSVQKVKEQIMLLGPL